MQEISENSYIRKILQNCHEDREDLIVPVLSILIQKRFCDFFIVTAPSGSNFSKTVT